MFTDFLFLLREQGIKVSTTEWITLLEALSKGFSHQSVTSFYYLCRAICVKNESAYDDYDKAFAAYFNEAQIPEKLKDEVHQWLENPIAQRKFSQEELAKLQDLDLDQLKKQFQERLREQNERHDGGNKWVGTGGTSPFGHSGYHPSGLRMGGQSRSRSAAQIASERNFRNLRNDRIIDTRQIGIALKKLRKWQKIGVSDELNLPATIDETCRNGGEISVVMSPSRRSSVKVLLLMDVGGSMTAHSKVCEQLFSAAHSSKNFKELRPYYFHNCPYEFLFEDIQQGSSINTETVLKQFDKSWYLIIVGDAAMHPWELTERGGSIDYFHQNEVAGIDWLKKIRQHFPKSVWINPEPESAWNITSTMIVQKVFSDMFPMTIAGIENAMKELAKRRDHG